MEGNFFTKVKAINKDLVARRIPTVEILNDFILR